jgi:transposase
VLFVTWLFHCHVSLLSARQAHHANACPQLLTGLLHDQVTSELACPGWVSWKDVSVPRPYPREFRDDVVRVARNRDDGVTIEQIATDFGVHPMTLHKWMRQADIDEGTKPGESTGELRDARRRIKLLEQENEVLRRAAAYLSQANLPGKGSTRS